jgi:polar amino acid transport system substrate-binding protein
MSRLSCPLLAFVCLTLLLLFPQGVVPARAEEPVVLVTGEYPPYVMSKGKRAGLLTEIVQAAFAEAGLETRVLFRPWRRCAMMIREGEAFGAYPYARTEKRAEYARFSDSIWVCRNVFFYLKGRMGEFDYTSLDDLSGYIIAGTSGHYYEDIFRQKGLNVDYAPGEASGVRRLWELRAALFAEDELVGWTLINRIFPSHAHLFGSTPTPWNLNPQHLMVSKIYPGSDRLMERFNAGLAVIRGNGTYERLVKKYSRRSRVLPDDAGVEVR